MTDTLTDEQIEDAWNQWCQGSPKVVDDIFRAFRAARTRADQLERRLWAIIDLNGPRETPSDIVDAVSRVVRGGDARIAEAEARAERLEGALRELDGAIYRDEQVIESAVWFREIIHDALSSADHTPAPAAGGWPARINRSGICISPDECARHGLCRYPLPAPPSTPATCIETAGNPTHSGDVYSASATDATLPQRIIGAEPDDPNRADTMADAYPSMFQPPAASGAAEVPIYEYPRAGDSPAYAAARDRVVSAAIDWATHEGERDVEGALRDAVRALTTLEAQEPVK